MSSIRFRALETSLNRQPVKVTPPSSKVSDYYGVNVFNREAMQKFLQRDAYKAVIAAIEHGAQIDRKMADQVALGMKEWANTKGATSYTHWFQPLTGLTAEKHDSFFELSDGKAIEHFSGNALAQQEPDASSFPNGGIRNTFEARGYTAWDPSSPAFIMENAAGKTLCIPTIFVSYTGESLDTKTPLLKALVALDKAATDVCQYFDKNVTRVTATLGWEQEYFVIDAGLANTRPDLVLTGRTVFGHAPAKGQQLEDHYFGAIPERVYAFMRDFEIECLKLGIPVRTRHNEVAPSQFECAPMFEEANLAVDHNSLLMDVMDRVSSKHKLKVLFHEKPFAGINGSGKHNNWSLGTDTGVNLLSPGKTPRTNLQFLTFFINTIAAVNRHEELLRASVASHGNEHRLGANEAPPAIVSVFSGSYLKEVIDMIETRVDEDKFDEQDNITLRLDIHNRIPDIMLDNTDRNRTSPFAFTGNKFEFRAVGSSANCALPMTVLNTIVAEQLKIFKAEVDEYIKGGDYKDVAILKVLRKTIKEAKRVMFEGDNYSDDWAKEAKKRGLSNNKTAPVALGAFVSDKSVKLFEEQGIYSHREIEARYEIALENYIKAIQIESRALGEIVINQIIPACLEYQNKLITNVKGLKEIGLDAKLYAAQTKILTQISEGIDKLVKLNQDMFDLRVKGNDLKSAQKQASLYVDKVKPLMDEIRDITDKLEGIVDDELWPLPKYREMLFAK